LTQPAATPYTGGHIPPPAAREDRHEEAIVRCLTWIAIVILGAIYTVSAQPTPRPDGYRESGGYCAPTSDRAPVAIPKRGQCPSNWVHSGNYCVQMQQRR
jgi:hypothetical protein